MAIAVPTSPPPLALQSKALPALLARLDVSNPNHPDLGLVKVILAITARQALTGRLVTDVRPLQALASSASLTGATADVLLHLVISYPTHLRAITPLVGRILESNSDLLKTIRTEVIPDIVTRLRLSNSPSDLRTALKILLALLRAHEELLGVVLSEADYIIPALRDAYPKLGKDMTGLRAKSDALLLCHALVQVLPAAAGREALKRLMESGNGAGPSKRALVSAGLRADYEAIFERMSGLGDAEVDALKRIKEDEAASLPVSGSVFAEMEFADDSACGRLLTCSRTCRRRFCWTPSTTRSLHRPRRRHMRRLLRL
jgi:hypothetical protein